MEDYIKRKDALDIFSKYMFAGYRGNGKSFFSEIVMPTFYHAIAELPSADVVEVVRCKDCIWHREEDNGDLFCEIKLERWVAPYAVRPEHYCSSGEREDEE